MTPEELQAIEARANLASPGAWYAAARTDVLALIAYVRKLEDEIQALLEAEQ